MSEILRNFIIRQLTCSESHKDKKADLFIKYLSTLNNNSSELDFINLRKKIEEVAEKDSLAWDVTNVLTNFMQPLLNALYNLKYNNSGSRDLPELIIECNVFPSEYMMTDGKRWIFKTKELDADHKLHYKKIFSNKSVSYHFAGAYACRNMTAHEFKNLSFVVRAQYFENLINMFVESIWAYRGYVESFITMSNLNLRSYFNKALLTYKKQKKYNHYIPPMGKVRRLGNSATDEQEEDIFDFYKQCEGSKRMRIVGSAGMGKTTAINELIKYDIENYNNHHRIPVIIKLINISDPKIDIEKYIADILEVSYDEVKEILDKGGFTVYLDGLNEITLDGNEQRTLLVKIGDFIEKYVNSYIILSNRENIHIEIMNGEATYYVLPLNDSQIDDFIKKNCVENNKLAIKAVEALNRLFDTYPVIKKSARIPYMLRQLIEIAILSPDNLPHKEIDITKNLLEALFERERVEKKERLVEYAEILLAGIAGSMPPEDNGYLEINRIKRIILDIIDDNVLPIVREDVEKVLTLFIDMGILAKIDKKIMFSSLEYKDYYFYIEMNNI